MDALYTLCTLSPLYTQLILIRSYQIQPILIKMQVGIVLAGSQP